MLVEAVNPVPTDPLFENETWTTCGSMKFVNQVVDFRSDAARFDEKAVAVSMAKSSIQIQSSFRGEGPSSRPVE